MVLTSDEYDKDSDAFFGQIGKDLERHHPEITLEDLIGHAKVLPDDNLITRTVNESQQTAASECLELTISSSERD
jgi:hypothetical protein